VLFRSQLPPDCWCTGYAEVIPEFHPRYDARSRTYRYYFPTLPADMGAMARSALQFRGDHNFTNFARIRGRNPDRTVLSVAVEEENGFVYFEVTAGSFLWHQVRSMATALWRVGAGEADEGSIVTLLEEPADHMVPPAPAEGLILWDTDCNIGFTPVPVDKRSASYLDHLRRHHALMERVCGMLGGGEPPHECDRDP
jgi:tRNA pseudouridine38-40 synthase